MTQSVTADNHAAQLMRALGPDYIKVDGRDSRDRLAFAARFAELIMFYNKNNQLAGNWKPFFVKDPLILLAVISKTDYTSYHRQFTQLQQQINKLNASANKNQKIEQNSNTQAVTSLVQPATATSVADYALSINQLFLLLQQMFCTINEWVHFMQMDATKYYLREFVYKKICENIAPQLWQMVALQQGFTIATKGAIDPPDTNTYNQFNAVWRDKKISQTNYSVQVDPRVQTESNAATESAQVSIENAIEQIQAIYHLVFSFFLQVIDNAKQSFYQMESQPCDYPDTALLITFSQLMENQQKLLNQFSGKHLDFYYKDILQQSPRSAQPDQVNICVQLADTVDSLSLPAGTEFIAGKYPDKSDITFVSLADAEINRAAISSVYTLYYSPPLLVSPPATNASVDNCSTENSSRVNPGLYLTTIANANQVVLNQQQEIVSWDGFGNTLGAPIQQGFSFASPMLYLQGGERTITLVFEFNNSLPTNFFDDSQFYLSTEKSWFLVAAQTVPTLTDSVVKADTSTGTSIISCQLKVLAAGPAIVPFVVNPDDPDNPASPWPLLKVILGKSVDLRDPPVLLSVSIKTDVKNFNTLNLANDVSALPATAPALMFGPIPNVGSCFYIGSNEVFAKPLTELSLTLTWDGLPPDFNTYYKSYNDFLGPKAVQFSNSAFQGQWTLLTQKAWQNLPFVATEKKTMTPDLATGSSVELAPESNTLVADNSDATVVNNSEEKPAAVNLPLFQQPPKETTPNNNNPTSIFTFTFDQAAPYIPSPAIMLSPLPLPGQAENGYVCVELTTPSYAFGHSLYPKVVANVSLVNAQLLIKQAKVNDSGTVIIIIKKIVAKITEFISKIKIRVKKIISGFIEFIKKIFKHGSKKNAEDANKDDTQKSATENDDDVIQPMPDLPYSPKQSGLLVNYSAIAKTAIASVTTPTTNASTQINYPFQLYHYGSFKPYLVFDALAVGEPLGYANLTPNQSSTLKEIKLFSGVSGEGCLYLAIKNLIAPCTLRLWVELSQDDNANELSTDSPAYYFWTASGWQTLRVLQNDTNNFNCSGIIVFDIPQLSAAEARDESLTYLPSPVMSGSDFWLAIASKKTNLNIKFSYINTQAITLSRASLSSLPIGDSPIINAASISATKEKMIKIARITQPFASTGGAPAEDQGSYYWRVSNRLNHKDRVSTRTNYESMATAAYTNLFYVKTLIPEATTNKISAGAIRLGLVNAYANAQLPNAFRPVVNACDKVAITKYIAARVSAMAQVSVFNLNHQVVTIKATLIVQTLANANALIQQINQELKIYLSPWISSDLPQVSLQQGISRAALTSFLIRYQGVVELAQLNICLSPVNISVANETDIDAVTVNDDIVVPVDDDVIFVSATQHQIQISLDSTQKKQAAPQLPRKVSEVSCES